MSNLPQDKKIILLFKKQHREVLAATFENSDLAIKYLNEHYADIHAAIHLFNNENCDFVPFIALRNKAQWSYLVKLNIAEKHFG